MKQAAVAVVILLLALLAAALVLLLRGGEWEEVVEQVGPAGPARENPYLALERLLSRMGVETRSAPILADLPRPAPEVVFLLAPTRRAWPERDDRLLAWVDEGGHLVLGATDPDPLLQRLDLERDGWLVRLRSETYLDPSDWEGLARPVNAISFPRNRGRITVLTGQDALAQRGLGEPGRAGLVWEIACLGAGPPRRALVVHADEAPGLLQLLLAHAWPLVLALLLLLLTWLWGVSRRFGPLLPEVELARRSLAEHVQATGRLLWRHGRYEPLLLGPRDALRERVRARHPELAHLEDGELAARLAPLVGLPPHELLAALTGPGAHPDDFTRAVRTLARARKELQ